MTGFDTIHQVSCTIFNAGICHVLIWSLAMGTFLHRGKKEVYAVSCSWLSSLTAIFYTCSCCHLIRPCSPLWVAMSRHDTARVTLKFLLPSSSMVCTKFDVWGTNPWWVFAEQLWFSQTAPYELTRTTINGFRIMWQVCNYTHRIHYYYTYMNFISTVCISISM